MLRSPSGFHPRTGQPSLPDPTTFSLGEATREPAPILGSLFQKPAARPYVRLYTQSRQSSRNTDISPISQAVAAHLHQNIRHYPLPVLPPVHVFVAGPRAGEMVLDEEARQIIAAVQARAPEAFHHQVSFFTIEILYKERKADSSVSSSGAKYTSCQVGFINRHSSILVRLAMLGLPRISRRRVLCSEDWTGRRGRWRRHP